MQVQSVRNDNINFGHKLPDKKTYRAMYRLYRSTDAEKAMEYRVLAQEARARLHYIEHKKAQKALIDKADEGYSDSKIKFLAELIKLRMKSVYEKAVSVFYYYHI